MIVYNIIHFRDNQLSDVEELNKLVCLKSLKTLVVSDNSFSKNSIRSKVLKSLPWLERIDKGTISPAERWHGKSRGEEENDEENDEEEEEEEEEE